MHLGRLDKDTATHTHNTHCSHFTHRFELIPEWFNYVEPDTGFDNIDGTAYAMKMFENDGTGAAGTPKSIMNLVARPPTMLPTEQLHEQLLNAAGASS